MTKAENVTLLLASIKRGEQHAAADLIDLVYTELRQLAQHKMNQEKPGQTLQATALVHEAYLRLLGDDSATWENRAHFFAAAAEAMRRILVEQARRKAAPKHGGEQRHVELRESFIALDDDSTDLVALSKALDRLHDEDPRKATLVKLRYFTGLTVLQAAEALGVSHTTAERWWAYSRVRLFRWIQGRS